MRGLGFVDKSQRFCDKLHDDQVQTLNRIEMRRSVNTSYIPNAAEMYYPKVHALKDILFELSPSVTPVTVGYVYISIRFHAKRKPFFCCRLPFTRKR